MHTTDKQTRNDHRNRRGYWTQFWLRSSSCRTQKRREVLTFFFLVEPSCFLVELVEMIVLFYTNLFLLYISIFFMLFSPLGECCFFR